MLLRSQRKQTSEADVGGAFMLCPRFNCDVAAGHQPCACRTTCAATSGLSVIDDRQLLPHFQAYPCRRTYADSGPIAVDHAVADVAPRKVW